MTKPEIKIGMIFHKLGSWYSTVDEVIAQKGEVALVKAHEDDGFVKYYIFDYDGRPTDDGWRMPYSSTDLQSLRWQYEAITDNM